MVVRLRKGPTGPLAESSDAGISTVRWVDPATELSPSEQTGSVTTPFATIQAAVDSLAAASEVAGTVNLAPGDYRGESVAWTSGETLTLQGSDSIRNIGTISSSLDARLRLVGLGAADARVGLISLTDTTLEVDSCFISTVTATGSPTRTRQSDFGGVCSVQGLTDEESIFRDSVTVTSASSTLHTEFRSSFSGTNFSAVGTTFEATLACSDTCRLTQCSITGDSTFTEVHANLCNFQGQVTVTLDSRFASTTLLGGIDGAAVDLEFDAFSYGFARAQGQPILFTGLVFIDPPARAIVPIVVPIVVAGSVGYLDVSLVGTLLEGVFDASNQPVGINPTADLAAAGLGGGLLNARITGPDTLRCTFIGPLAGGPTNITVSRVS